MMRTYHEFSSRSPLVLAGMVALFLNLAAVPSEADTVIEWSPERDGNSQAYTAEGLDLRLSSAKAGQIARPRLQISTADGVSTIVVGPEQAFSAGASIRVTHLDSIHSKIDVLFGAFTGGAHCCMEIKVISLIDRQWRIADLGDWDGDGMPEPRPVNGKSVLVFGDNDFLYAFAPYAFSATPLKILKVEDGQVVNVSADPAYKGLHRQNMVENQKFCAQKSNGGCAAYVASAARIGSLHDAWNFMLSHFDRQSDWNLEFCDVPGKDKCARSVSFKSFPEALEWFLHKHGYIQAAQLPGAQEPSGPPVRAPAEAADEVPLEQQGGTFVIPVRINGAITLPFIIDSGAADVQIPADVFSTLIRANTILPGDIVGRQTYRMADGSTREEPRFFVRELRVGDHVLRNVPASVGFAAGELLLGQSFLSQFDSWTLDNRRHVLKLVERSGTTSTAGSPAGDVFRPGPTAMVTTPPPNVTPGMQSAVLCGRQVNYAIDPSGSSTGFLGVWAGNWNNPGRLCGGLIVEKIDPHGAADVIYVFGPSQSGSRFPWRQQQRIGTVSDGKLRFEDDQGSTFTFYSGGYDQLNATFISRSGRLSGSFQKSR